MTRVLQSLFGVVTWRCLQAVCCRRMGRAMLVADPAEVGGAMRMAPSAPLWSHSSLMAPCGLWERPEGRRGGCAEQSCVVDEG